MDTSHYTSLTSLNNPEKNAPTGMIS